MNDPPPADLADLEPLLFEVPAGQEWFRSHSAVHDPLFFGKASLHRWDAPGGEYGVLYLAEDPFGAFMESIGRGVLRTRFVPRADLEGRCLSRVRSTRQLRLIDLSNSGGLTRVGAESSLTSGAGYRESQRWSLALRAHPVAADGLYYRSRYDPARSACALFEECAGALETTSNVIWAELRELLGEILDHYRFGTDL